MKKNIFNKKIIFLILLKLILLACFEPKQGIEKYPQKIIALPEENINFSLKTKVGEDESELLKPYLRLNYNEQPIQLLTINLDLDEQLEQIIIVKQHDQDSSKLKLYIADFNPYSSIYWKSFETDLVATDEKTIQIDVKDIIGNQTFQIVVSGMNAEGKVTMEIFRPQLSSNYLNYISIFKLTSSGIIEIAETDSNAGYSGGHRYGASFPIYVLQSNSELSNYGELFREIYRYDFYTGRYQHATTEKIKPVLTGEESLDLLFQTNSTEAFNNFAKGLWFSNENDSSQRLILYNPEQGEISFYMSGFQEVYKIKYSRRSLFNTLSLYTENDLLHSLKANITLTILSSFEIEVVLTEYSTMEQWLNEQWGGRYQRLASQPENPLISPLNSKLSGQFISKTGDKLIFNFPKLEWISKTEKLFAYYSLIQDAEKLLLCLVYLPRGNLDLRSSNYLLRIIKKQEYNQTIEAFSLSEIEMHIYNSPDKKKEDLYFSRIAN